MGRLKVRQPPFSTCLARDVYKRQIQDKPVKITGAKQFSNKWTQESYQDFLQNLTWAGDMILVSYTHLDVYKRQG